MEGQLRRASHRLGRRSDVERHARGFVKCHLGTLQSECHVFFPSHEIVSFNTFLKHLKMGLFVTHFAKTGELGRRPWGARPCPRQPRHPPGIQHARA